MKTYYDRNTKPDGAKVDENGFRMGSAVSKLTMHIREEYRAKYWLDYELKRTGKNRFKVIPGTSGDFGVEYINQYAEQFGVTIED